MSIALVCFSAYACRYQEFSFGKAHQDSMAACGLSWDRLVICTAESSKAAPFLAMIYEILSWRDSLEASPEDLVI